MSATLKAKSPNIFFAIMCLLIPVWPAMAETATPELTRDDQINLYCLSLSYPLRRESTKAGDILVVSDGGETIPYMVGGKEQELRAAMQVDYPLEPTRPDTPAGFAPGRIRSYPLLGALYGHDAQDVSRQLTQVSFAGKKISLHKRAAQALQNALPELNRLLQDRQMGAWLAPAGGFFWRKIAGEQRLSAHAFGIALDLSPEKAPYWRWSKKNPHPLQQTYPGEIVRVMEDNGFIWGGKWHEYDLMHFEYRPELICRAKMKQAQGSPHLPRVKLGARESR